MCKSTGVGDTEDGMGMQGHPWGHSRPVGRWLDFSVNKNEFQIGKFSTVKGWVGRWEQGRETLGEGGVGWKDMDSP